ncbi:hypothetical protein F4823DRAFT_623658 [Ustulina deusta]|nr:hypothetical protein F4823DRAFT_623658 [Ustulina deusta]
MDTQPGQPSSLRKRRRQTVVCTECRRRKIACDRNIPCTQCAQSGSACTYYNSYSNSGGFSNDQGGSTKPPFANSASSLAETNYILSSRPPPSALMTPSHSYATFPSRAEAGIEPPVTSISIDGGASSWFDPVNLGAPGMQLNMLYDTNTLPFTSASADNSQDPDVQVTDAVTEAATSPQAKVMFQKSRLYGPSHWMTLCRKKYENHGLFHDISTGILRGDTHPVLQKCKRLAKALKAEIGLYPKLLLQPLRDLLPPKEVSDRLLQLYLQTFESVFRILHIPSFRREYEQYWSDPGAANESLELQILLVLAIGTCFYQEPLSSDSTDGLTLHEQSAQWIHAVHVRLAVPLRKKNLNLRGVQTQCLLVLSMLTNTNAVGGDLFWITTALLAQSAMAIGLHFGPSQLPMSPFEAEIKRRLWVTVLELVAQASLDSGTHPVIPPEALDMCEIPSNLDDSQFSELSKTLPTPQPISTFTQSSIQCALLKSLPIRYKIAETLSWLRAELPYDSAQCMGAELTAHLRETSSLIDSFGPKAPCAFQIQLQDLLARRFLLVLHAQFAHKASTDAKYYFSRTVCLECSLLLLSPARNGGGGGGGNGTTSDSQGDRSRPSSHEFYDNLRMYGEGLFKNVFMAAAINLCAEVLLQLRDDSAPAAASLSRRELLQAIEDAAALTRRRIQRGETSVKAHVFLICVLAQTGAARRRSSSQPSLPTHQAMEDARRRALDACCIILEARVGRLATRTNSDLGYHGFSSRPRNEYPVSPSREGGGSDTWLSQLTTYTEQWVD